jgi:hypothetical protein
VHLRGLEESERVLSVEPVLIDSLLALNTTRRPWHGRYAFRADCRFALDADSKAALVNPPQRGYYLTQQDRLTVHLVDRQISFGRAGWASKVRVLGRAGNRFADAAEPNRRATHRGEGDNFRRMNGLFRPLKRQS